MANSWIDAIFTGPISVIFCCSWLVFWTNSLVLVFSVKSLAKSCSFNPFSSKPAWHCSKCRRASCSFKRLCSTLSRMGCNCCSFCIRTRSSICNCVSASAKWLRASASAVSRNCLILIASVKFDFSVSIGVSFIVASASAWRNKNMLFSLLFTLIL